MKRVTALERAYLAECLSYDLSHRHRAGFVARFERRFAKMVGARYAIAHANGTATIQTALAALGIGPEDEVLVPALTMMSPTLAVLQSGATPVFVDVHPLTWTIDPSAILRAITRRTKAVILVTLYGSPGHVREIRHIARRFKIALIEDNAQCVNGRYEGKPAGSWGTFASFSFQNSKHLSAGEGGVLTTSDRSLALAARRVAGLGFSHWTAESVLPKPRPAPGPDAIRHVSLGWNALMAEPVAAIALAQTERMTSIVGWRRRVADEYRKAHVGCDWLIPQVIPRNAQHAYWTYPLLLAPHAPMDWDAFVRSFKRNGGDDIYGCWKVNYLEPALSGLKSGTQPLRPGLCPVAESLQPRLLQFKTNLKSLSEVQKQTAALKRTLSH